MAKDGRTVFYAFGAGLGLLLDQEGTAWRDRYLAEKFYLERYRAPRRDPDEAPLARWRCSPPFVVSTRMSRPPCPRSASIRPPVQRPRVVTGKSLWTPPLTVPVSRRAL